MDQQQPFLSDIKTLRERARKHMEEGAVTPGYKADRQTVIKLLNTFGDLSLSSLSERIRAQNSTVTGIIDRMEREGLVSRERSTSDRRVVFIRITDKGKRLAHDIAVEPMDIRPTRAPTGLVRSMV